MLKIKKNFPGNKETASNFYKQLKKVLKRSKVPITVNEEYPVSVKRLYIGPTLYFEMHAFYKTVWCVTKVWD